VKRILVSAVIVGAILALIVLPASASLVPMSWGMPIMSQTGSLTAFQQDSAVATDNEAAAVAFPSTTGVCGSVFGSAFPTITQTALQSQALNSVRFMNENQNFFAAYPYLSIGGAPIPSMGFL
jgi:hypothetical protein